MLQLLVLCCALAPAPFKHAPAPHAILAAPDGARKLADRLNSPEFVRAVLKIKFPIAPPAVTEEWARSRFRAVALADGKSVRLSVERGSQEEAINFLEAAIEEHLRRIVPGRRSRLADAEKHLGTDMRKIPPKYRKAVRDYFRKLYNKDAPNAVIVWPRPGR
jgi:hypothetical protein